MFMSFGSLAFFMYLAFISLSHQEVLIDRLSPYKAKLNPPDNIKADTKLEIEITGNFTAQAMLYISRDFVTIVKYAPLTKDLYVNSYFVDIHVKANSVIFYIQFLIYIDDDTYWEITSDDESGQNIYDTDTLIIDLFFVYSVNEFKLRLSCFHFFSHNQCYRNKINQMVQITCTVEIGETGQPLKIILPKNASYKVVHSSPKTLAIKTKLAKDLKDLSAICVFGSHFIESSEPYKYMVDVFQVDDVPTAAKAVTTTLFILLLAAAITLAIYYIFLLPMRQKRNQRINNYLGLSSTVNEDIKRRCSMRMATASGTSRGGSSGSRRQSSVGRQSMRRSSSFTSMGPRKSINRRSIRKSIRRDMMGEDY